MLCAAATSVPARSHREAATAAAAGAELQHASVLQCHGTAAAVRKAAETNKATVEDSLSRKLDEINRVFDETDALLKKYGELLLEESERERRRKTFVRRTLFAAGALAAIYYYVNQRFFGGTKEEMSSTENKRRFKRLIMYAPVLCREMVLIHFAVIILSLFL